MPTILPVNGKYPKIGKNCFIAPNATIVGDVEIGDDCSVWFNAVIRGDVNSIKIGNQVNIQDGAVIHCTFEKSVTTIGDNVSIGHNAIVHGCTIEADVLVGMGAIVMDHTIVKSGCIIGAGAVIAENKTLEGGWVYAGVPAKPLKEASAEQVRFFITRTAENYKKYASWFTNPE
ncbi:MAG: gamma carbonic anhydrase family protein [Saprospiraceae bacterium]|nr:gamma carbonic anhydrase family protein [Saprospiraceae bacterium]